MVPYGKICQTPSPAHEMELSLALFAAPFAIGGMGLIVTRRFERREVENRSHGA